MSRDASQTADGRLPAALRSLMDDAVAAFHRTYGYGPAVAGFAPGRVNLIGEHTDYNGGLCLPMAIDRWTVAVMGRDERLAREGEREWPAGVPARLVRAASTAFAGLEVFPVDREFQRLDREVETNWIDYVRGVFCVLCEETASRVGTPDGFWNELAAPVDLLVHSTVPVGAGLSSSAALEVAVARALLRLIGGTMGDREVAVACQAAEHRATGVPCGLLDQLTAAVAREGELLRIDFGDGSVERIRFPDELAVLVIDSGVRHRHAGSAELPGHAGSESYAVRRWECEEAARRLGVPSLREVCGWEPEEVARLLPEPLGRRVRHVVSEHQRTMAFCKALEGGDWRAAGETLFAGHWSLARDFAVSCRELDQIVRLCERLAGEGLLYGARMTGGGFGGNVVCLARSAAAQETAERIARDLRPAGRQESTVVAVQPASGAFAVRL